MNLNWYQRWWKALRGEVATLPIWMIAFYFVISRLLIILMAVLSMKIIRPGAFPHTAHLIDTFARWDTAIYISIATSGYYYHPGKYSSVAFFPLYPMALHVVGFAIHDLRIAGYLISNLSLFAACLVFWKLVARDYGGRAAADRAIVFLLLGPVSFFFSIIYTEALFFLLFVLVAYFATGRRWIAAGVCGYLAALTRVIGLLALVLLVMEFAGMIAERGRELGLREGMRSVVRSSGLPFLSSVVLTVCGFGSQCLYLWSKFGDPLVFVQAEKAWGKHNVYPWKFFQHDPGSHYSFYPLWFEGSIWLALALFVIGLVLRIRLSHSITTISFLVFYLSTNLLESVPRLLSVLFPFYITLALVATRWPRLEAMLLAGSTMLLAFSTILFVNGYWFT